MNTLLVWPEIPVTYWGGHFSTALIGKSAFMPPLGLLTVAALCPQDWDYRLIDLNIRQLSDADIEWADLIMMSGMVIQHKSMMEVLERAKRAGKAVAVGGPHATSSPEKFDDANYLILDEGEITLPMFLADFASGNAKRLYTADGDKPDITKTPLPRFDLLDVNAYTHMCVQYSRGCPFACEFCDITTLYGKKPRTKTPEQIVAELQLIYETGFRGEVFLVDDNFIGNKKNVKQMLPAMVEWMEQHEYPFWLYTEASINLADDDELLELMGKAGFHSVFVGIESPSIEALRETHKYQNVHGDLLGKVHKIQEYGMEVMAGFIVGFDSDRADIFDAQIEFITAARIPMAMIGPLNAMPNTQLWVRLEREGRLNADFEGDTFGFCNFKTVMPEVELIRGYRNVLASLYSAKAFFGRLRAVIEALKGSNQSFGRLSRATQSRYLLPLIKGMLKMKGDDGYRKECWRFMVWVLRNHPEKWLYALCRAITGYHFIRYTSSVMIPRLTVLEAEMLERQKTLTVAA